MNTRNAVIIAAVVGVLAIGSAFAVTWDMPAPTQPIEKVIPNERLPR